MSGAVRLVRLKVQGFGVLGDRPVELGPFGDGVNLITGPNECGKSTLVRALRLALFQRHGSRGKDLLALRPHGTTKAAPTVEVELTIDGTRYRLEKRFLSGAMARLHVGDDPHPLKDEDADARIVTLLEARQGARKASDDDMGVWGLLWVGQDELAAKEPAESLGDNVRGTLASAIEQQVGAVMGGGEGVRLYDAVEAEYGSYFTAKQDRQTGMLAQKLAVAEALEQEVAGLEAKVKESEVLAADVAAREEDLERLRGDEVAFQREHDEAHQALDAVETLALAARETEATWNEAAAATTELAAALTERVRQVEEGAALAHAVREQAGVADAAHRNAEDLQREADAAGAQAELATKAYEDVRSRSGRLSARLAALRAQETLARKETDLAGARRLAEEIEQLRAAVRGLPDGDLMRRIEEAEERRVHTEERARRSMTRVLVERPGADAVEHFVAQRQRIDLGDLGAIEIEPPRTGFTRAREAWRAAREALQRALAGLHVDSVSRARALAEERADVERQLATRRDELARITTKKSLAELETELERAGRELEELDRKLTDARRAREERDTLDQQLAGLPVDTATARELDALVSQIRALEAREVREGVLIQVRPLAAVRVQIGERDTPRLLTPGRDLQRAVTAPMTLVIDEKLELLIDPGVAIAADTVAARVQLERTLTDRLAALGLTDVGEAFKQAELRTQRQALRESAAQRLEQLARDGVEALAERVDRRRRRRQEVDGQVRAARPLEKDIEGLQHRLAALPVTVTAFEELDALDREALAREQEVHRTVGRLLHAEGALAGEWTLPHDLMGELGALVAGAKITVTPREAEGELALPMLRGDLARLLASCRAETVAVARAMHQEWLRDTTLLTERQRELKRLAPGDLEALEAEVHRLRSTGPAEDPPVDGAVTVAAVEELLRSVRSDQTDAETRAKTAAEHARRLRIQLEEAARRAETADRALSERKAQWRATENLLASQRAVRSDEALEAALATARTREEAARAARTTAREEYEAALPDVRRGELHRAQRALESHRQRFQLCRDELIERRGALQSVTREGRFDALEEKRADLRKARGEHEDLERQARAVRLLREVARSAYSEAQRMLLTPVYEEAQPLLRMIRPDTTFQMSHGTLTLEHVTSRGHEERFGDLSGGTREQLAVIVRIALARVFARHRRALPLILDDILGWTDDRRFVRMIQVLEHAARDMQVILLTCHPTRFSRFGDVPTFELDRLKAQTSA